MIAIEWFVQFRALASFRLAAKLYRWATPRSRHSSMRSAESDMGSSTWLEFAPFNQDLGATLAYLHADVFENERYFDRVATHAARYSQNPRLYPRPATSAALIARVGLGRTHSILDIQRFSTRWEEGAARPLTIAQQRRWLRTEQPTHAQTLTRAEYVANQIPSECACYFMVYTDTQPSEWCFIGVTGDG